MPNLFVLIIESVIELVFVSVGRKIATRTAAFVDH